VKKYILKNSFLWEIIFMLSKLFMLHTCSVINQVLKIDNNQMHDVFENIEYSEKSYYRFIK